MKLWLGNTIHAFKGFKHIKTYGDAYDEVSRAFYKQEPLTIFLVDLQPSVELIKILEQLAVHKDWSIYLKTNILFFVYPTISTVSLLLKKNGWLVGDGDAYSQITSKEER